MSETGKGSGNQNPGSHFAWACNHQNCTYNDYIESGRASVRDCRLAKCVQFPLATMMAVIPGVVKERIGSLVLHGS